MTTRRRTAASRPELAEPDNQQPSVDAHVKAAQVVEVPTADELDESFTSYAMSVITARAIPDVRDGLKPVQRRILWTMHEMGAGPNAPHRKSARVVGDTMGRYHPHGDSAIYDALVRMAQPHSLRLPLIDPQGNFGSPDDPPAASRYTECRLGSPALTMIDGAGEETVDWVPSYDGEGLEPSVLPAGVPHLLVNGASGIAVGLTTECWPHNLGEVAEAVKDVMAADESGKPVSAKRLARKLPGPDFPSGGVVVAAPEDIAAAYESGKGAVTVRGRWHAEPVTKSRQAVVITELPPGVGAEKLLDRIAKSLDEDKNRTGLGGLVAKAADHSDRSGLRVLVELRPGADPVEAVEALCRRTPMQTREPLNFVALAGGVPVSLSLQDAIRHWVEHRQNVIRRRTNHRLAAASRKLKLADASAAATSALDKTIDIIRRARDADTARNRLKKELKIDEEQAEHILNMTLRRVNRLDRKKLDEERANLRSEIAGLEKLAGSEAARRDAIRDELAAAVKAHDTPRRTQILASDGAKPVAASHGGAAQTVTVTTAGRLAVGPAPSRPSRNDLAVLSLSSDGGALSAVSAAGAAGRIPADPEAAAGMFSGRDKAVGAGPIGGETLVAFSDGTCRVVQLPSDPQSMAESWPKGEQAVAAWPLDAATEVLAASSDGKVARVSLEDQPGGRLSKLMNIKSGAELVWAVPFAGGEDQVVLLAAGSSMAAFRASDLPVYGRGASGVLGLKVKPGEKVTVAVSGPAAAIRLIPTRGRVLSLSGGQIGKRGAAPKKMDCHLVGAGLTP